MRNVIVFLVRAYQVCVSPLFPPRCRFFPTCSEYTIQAVQEHGFWRGGYLAVRRISRCHPFHCGGVDPVPPKKSLSPDSK
ncbi:membrane protein insertion efficiency factor YidD [Desulfohalobium retbaense]|uniref:Putative membrane protein insertion efficiency factor n=1 Tax=Desulfohalobium retbaense (strain ATCC 49708 / DSM 5692 / JCM 16813 / HR100) TaxID=485915 RepID=C8X4F0_DESRD|nr:membrane protein insertion efficiency factor YidD [Desulfohalobium retbaense]ACV69424.1 protein of unknown function DUF37 [Desulfohalobium retbaense DSM 5692]